MKDNIENFQNGNTSVHLITLHIQLVLFHSDTCTVGNLSCAFTGIDHSTWSWEGECKDTIMLNEKKFYSSKAKNTHHLAKYLRASYDFTNHIL